jgi:6-phosphofructokinase 1
MSYHKSPSEAQFRPEDFLIQTLGESTIPTTLDAMTFVDGEYIVLDVDQTHKCRLEVAGPRSKIYRHPEEIHAGIITCGGLCPGINDVIRAIVMALYYRYGVKNITGFRYGYERLTKELSVAQKLNPETVRDIHLMGGTVLGTSRGPQNVSSMVQFLLDNGINMLFTVGGDGTLKGSQEISDEIVRLGHKIAVVGVPKTIDNDLLFMQKTFGFDTAVSMSQIAIKSANTEATSCRGGIGIVKLMGRESGFIALYASVASNEVNLLLLPEVPFQWEPIFEYVEWRLKTRNHCIIVVAEGAGQEHCQGSNKFDKSGNKILDDIGLLVKSKLGAYLNSKNIENTIKYIDPSYIIRSSPAEPSDKIFAIELAHMAVHAAMSGRTGIVPGMVQGRFVNLPIRKVVEKRRIVDPCDMFYQIFLDNSGQPISLLRKQE